MDVPSEGSGFELDPLVLSFNASQKKSGRVAISGKEYYSFNFSFRMLSLKYFRLIRDSRSERDDCEKGEKIVGPSAGP